jgi:hypothetical protein
MKQMARLSFNELEITARALDLQINKLDRRGAHQTASEHFQATELKKLRLQTKERLDELRHRYRH